jgi:hypothetical protein
MIEIRNEYFFEGQKNKNDFFLYDSDSVHLAAFLWRKLKIKSLLASMKSLIDTTVVFPVTIFWKLVSAFS